MRNGVILLIPFLLLTIMANSIVAREFKIISQFTQTPPVIDGKIGGPYSAPIPASQEAELIPDGEWASAQSVLLGGSSAGTKVNVYFLNDEKYLYVSFDFSEGQNNIAQIIIGKEKYSLSFLFDGYQLHYGLLSPTGEILPYEGPPQELPAIKAGMSSSPYSRDEHYVVEMAIPFHNNEPWKLGSAGDVFKIKLFSGPSLSQWPYFGENVEWGTLVMSKRSEATPSAPPTQLSFEGIMPMIAIFLLATACISLYFAIKPKKR